MTAFLCHEDIFVRSRRFSKGRGRVYFAEDRDLKVNILRKKMTTFMKERQSCQAWLFCEAKAFLVGFSLFQEFPVAYNKM